MGLDPMSRSIGEDSSAGTNDIYRAITNGMNRPEVGSGTMAGDSPWTSGDQRCCDPDIRSDVGPGQYGGTPRHFDQVASIDGASPDRSIESSMEHR
jgi:hypothetical protein